mmetsp:Transcript_18112/g.53655  ORF Transcript_18112/g.53655 Transcript_18112/m.53655 type:complete len:984 (+) Transcript_18112:203-3154(+)|eukprot:CAMPEP_0206290358 /NCGR_PEP_ID=MMETSP0106_2-20121207/2579_1 /ASSEMBLY_ACC=CAM_ASM_000206 /TAXON_ID=81532 /ORGANISM="Acanthoeca-like sp., Strain 10tr" /LENGTH=983 /DNA_ID=CAMNT_0053720917 /DNA_START=112 /DNA_END=3063 /DNA_ORIENTATION=+
MDKHPRPAVHLAAACLRRRIPKQWPSKGVPPIYKDYGALYDILLVEKDGEYSLPTAPVRAKEDPTRTAFKAWQHIRPKKAEMVDAVPVVGTAQTSLLMWMPVDKAFESGDQSGVDTGLWHEVLWVPLAQAMRALRPLGSATHKLSPTTKAQVSALEEWLADSHCLPEVVAMLWTPAARLRIKKAVANPLFSQRKRAAEARQPMLVLSNPLYRSGLAVPRAGTNFLLGLEADLVEFDENGRHHDALTPEEHSAAVRAVRHLSDSAPPPGSEPTSPEVAAAAWSEKYPVHKAAMEGDARRVRELILASYPPAEHDSDSWTPLHYAAWHGREGVVRILMADWQGSPTGKTDNGSTPLHFAARNGHPNVVTILLACPIVDPAAKDKDGLTPLKLARMLRLGDWAEVEKVLENPNSQNAVNRFKSSGVKLEDAVDFKIYLMDGTFKMVRLPGGDLTTAGDLRDGVGGMVHIPEECQKLFAIFVVSPSLSIQLDEDMKPLQRLERWPEMLERYTDPAQWSTIQHEVPMLVFRRNQKLTLSDERRVKSHIAMKFLFDEALVNFINTWPCTVDQAVHLAGLLMQIRFGEYDPAIHKKGFLSDGLATFVPQHLLHNQLKTAEWERRIYERHRQHADNTEIHILHRLFLQYCYQWPYYAATFFDVNLQRQSRRLIGGSKSDYMRLAVNTDWVCIVHGETNALRAMISMDQLTYEASANTITLECSNSSQVANLQHYIRAGGMADALVMASHQAYLAGMLFQLVTEIRAREEVLRQQKRVAQGGPLVMRHRAEQPGAAYDPKEVALHRKRMHSEKLLRYRFLNSFGTVGGDVGAAQSHFESRPSCVDGYVPIKDLKNVFAELGYGLGTEFELARDMLISTTSESVFNFRDLVSWWCQAKRGWLMLLDDSAFKERQVACSIFLRNDPHRTGKVVGEKLMGVVRGLRSANLTKKTEAAVREGMDPQKTGQVLFNDFIDYLCAMHIISDRKPSTTPI